MFRKPSYLLDTNIILRFLLNDHRQLSSEAKRIFQQGEHHKAYLVINHVTLAETVWVLESFYQLAADKVARLLIDLINLPNVKVPQKSLIVEALLLAAKKKIAYIDAYNLLFARNKSLRLKTFDRQLKKLTNGR